MVLPLRTDSYGMVKDVEAAVDQGCQENSHRLAMDQEPQPPLFLMGQLGNSDVRVQRHGDDIEVKIAEFGPYEVLKSTSVPPTSAIDKTSPAEALRSCFGTSSRNGSWRLARHQVAPDSN